MRRYAIHKGIAVHNNNNLLHRTLHLVIAYEATNFNRKVSTTLKEQL